LLGIGRGESYVIKQSGLWIQRDHTLDIESVLLADGVKGRVLIEACLPMSYPSASNGSPDMKTHIENAPCNRPLRG
jgi:hypothetical protein